MVSIPDTTVRFSRIPEVRRRRPVRQQDSHNNNIDWVMGINGLVQAAV